MKEWLLKFWNEEEGMGTVEIVLIIAVLIAIALIFRDRIIKFVEDLMEKVFPGDSTSYIPGELNGKGE